LLEPVTVAVNCCAAPVSRAAETGEMDTATNGGVVTVRVAGGLTTLPTVAVICEVPAATPVAKPVLAPIVAIKVFDDAHVALMLFVLPSLKVPVAENCCV